MAVKKKKTDLDRILEGTYQSPLARNSTKKPTASANITNFGGPVTAGKSNTREELTSSKRNDTWFQKGAFGDDKGNVVTDIIDTIIGTGADVGVGAVKGIFNVGEGIGDLITYGEAELFEAFGNEEYANNLRQEAQRRLADDWFNPIEDTLAKSSVIGDKGDSISEGIGFVLATIATGGVAGGLGKTASTAGKLATGATTGQTFLTSMGSSMGEAYRSGASDKEAWTYGTIGGLAEAGTELLFGGLGKSINALGLSKGLSSADDQLAKAVSSKFKSTLTKNLAEYGIKAGAEGFEEVASGVIQAMGQKLTYANDEEKTMLENIANGVYDYATEQMLDDFITGAIVSGIVQSPGLVSNTKAGQDFITGNTDVEQKVVDEMIEKRKQDLLSTKKEGETLSTKEIGKIQKEVQEDFENGRIDVKDIESIVGEDVVKDWNNKKTQLEGLYKELDTATNESSKKNIKAQIKALESEINSNSRIQRSYAEKQNKATEFVYKASGKESEFAKGVIESTKGKVNNTTHSHEMADTLIKMSEERGMQYKFTNNQELQDRKIVPKGKTANGIYEIEVDGKREILVNVDSKKYLEAVLVHETAHDFKTTDVNLYNNLSKATVEYAKAKGDYETISNEVNEMYKDVKGVQVDEEITSRLLEDYLGNKEFISDLSTKEPNIVKKLIDEIKYLYKKFTASSPEARKLLELQRNMEDAYKKAYRSTEVKGKPKAEVDYSVTDDIAQRGEDALKDRIKSLEKTVDDLQKAGNRDWIMYQNELEYAKDKLSEIETTKAVDNKGNELSKEQQNKFKGTKVLDENGNLLQMFHGTGSDFNTFDINKSGQNYEDGWSAYGSGFYFTADEQSAKTYAEESEGTNQHIKAVYLDVKKPFYANENHPELFDRYGLELSPNVTGRDFITQLNNRDGRDASTRALKELGYDGIIEDFGEKAIDEVVVFDSSQIKNVDNTKPTDNPDIRYSLSEDNQGRTLTKEQQEKIVDLKEQWANTSNFAKKMMLEQQIIALENGYDSVSDYNNSKKIKIEEEPALTQNEEVKENESLLKDKTEFVSEKGKGYKFLIKNGGKADNVMVTVTKKGYVFNNILLSDKIKGKGEGTKIALDLNQQSLKETGKPLQSLPEFNIVGTKNHTEEGKGLWESLVRKGYATKNNDNSYSMLENAPTIEEYIDSKRNIQFSLTNDLETKTRENMSRVQDNETIEFIDVVELENIVSRHNKGGRSEQYISELRQKIEENGITEPLEITINDYGEAILEDGNHRLDIAKDEGMKQVPIRIREANNEQTKMVYKKISDLNTDAFKTIQDSLSNETDIAPAGNGTLGSDIKLQVEEVIAPLQETITELTNEVKALKQAPEVKALTEEDIPFIEQMNNNASNVAPVRNNLTTEESNELDYLEAVEDGLNSEQQQRLAELREKETPIYNQDEITPSKSLFETRDYAEVGNQKVKAYQYENPEVKPYFKDMAQTMLYDLNMSSKGERVVDAQVLYDTSGESGVYGIKRNTTSDIEQLLDGVDGKLKLSYDEIRNGLNALIEDDGLENNKASKRIEFFIDQRLREGYTDIEGNTYPPNQAYLNMLREKNITEYNQESYDNWLSTLDNDILDSLIPVEDASNTDIFTGNVPNTNGTTPGQTNTLSTSEIAKKGLKNDLGYIPQDPTKESSYETSIKKDPVQDFVDNVVRKNNLNNIKEMQKPKVQKSKFKNLVDTGRTLFVNKFNEVDNLAKDTGNKSLTFKADMLNSVAGEIEGDINSGQTDNYGRKIGKSVRELFQPSKDAGLYEAFNDYLFNKSNVERHRQGKGSVIPDNVSRQLIQDYEKTYPQFKTWAKDVYKYYGNVLNNEVEAGLVSSSTAEFLRGDTMYPSYVPFYENIDTERYFDNRGEIKAPQVLKRAKGGATNVIGMEEAMIKQTYAYKSAIRKNNLYKEIVNTLEKQGLRHDVGGDARLDPTQLGDSLYIDENGNRFLTAYINGDTKSVTISEDLYKSLENGLGQQVKELEQKFSLITKPLQKLSEIRRNLLTTWSPSFLITNPLKDIQDAVFNSKYTKDMLKNYLPAYKELAQKNNATVQQFLTLYGTASNYGEFDIDSVNKPSKLKNIKMLQRLSSVNEVVELAPRYAEFKASLQNGTSVEEAIYNARDITTNFARGGEITKAMNRNGFTFLNASVQGFDKLYRNFSGENGVKGYVNVLSKAVIFGVAPALLNALLFDDDEEYEVLPDYIKDNYYLFKTGDGEFIRIPKGRVISVFGSAGRRTLELAQGEGDAFEGYFKNAYSQVGISNPLESNIFAPLIQAYGSEEGTTWYGEDLVPSRLQDLPDEEQYDASTDKVSQFLGEVLGTSPYKLNYIIDQYSGGIGDLILPTITDEASSNGSFLAPLKDKFTADSVTDNKNVGEIYSLSEELTKKSNSSKATEEDTLRSKYIYSITSDMNELYAERREIQNDGTLSKEEKYEKSQAIKEQINSLAKEGLENYENLTKTGNYATVGDKEYYKYVDDEGNDKWGTPREDELDELNALGMDINEKSNYFKAKDTISNIKDEYSDLLKDASDDEKDSLYAEQKANIINQIKNTNLTDDQKYYLYDRHYASTDTLEVLKSVHISSDAYFDYASQTFTADKDGNGKTINGSKKAKVFGYINSMDMSFEQKVILAKLEYNTYDEYNYEIIDYLNNDDSITYEDMESILKKLGFEVDSEGNISW